MYHLIAMIYYMGLVCLPPLCNYWSTDHYMPHHRVMKELVMTRDHFSSYGTTSMCIIRNTWTYKQKKKQRKNMIQMMM
eukprot:10975642-Ditylum_brightwellii.AAC.1